MVIDQKRAQVTIFIILGILVVAGIITYFVLQKPLRPSELKNFEPAYNFYLSCVEERAKIGINYLGQQGGYIYTEELSFEPGSVYAPTSSQLELGGVGVPYWSYVSGNNMLREQKPTIEDMQRDLSRFISEGINECNFDDFNSQGISVDIYSGDVDVKINENSVDIFLENSVYFYSEEDNSSAMLSEHKVSVDSKTGKFYNIASDVFNTEDKQTFLEDYGLDVMRLYAPVTGVELTCSPKVFNDNDIMKNIFDGLEMNIPFLKLKGNYYELGNKENKYFVVDLGKDVNEDVSFTYSKDWPTKIEIYGDRIVEPVGMQEGLALLGFCYVPYHFVYDISFPVLFQIRDGDDMFQFPMVAIIKNSQARNASLFDDGVSMESELCKYKNQNVRVSTFNLNSEPVEASLRFGCLSDGCAVGSTEIKGGEAVINAEFPQCVNGVLTAYADGYAPAEYIISTNRETSADVLMMKIYDVNVNLGNVKKAVVLFSSEDYSSALSYPEDKSVKLIEGSYNITAYVYSESNLIFPAVSETKCIDVSASGIAGMLGQEEQKCFDINTEEQTIDSALIGGGQGYDYFTESQLKSGAIMKIDVPLFGNPQTIEELQNNFIDLEDAVLGVSFA